MWSPPHCIPRTWLPSAGIATGPDLFLLQGHIHRLFLPHFLQSHRLVLPHLLALLSPSVSCELRHCADGPPTPHPHPHQQSPSFPAACESLPLSATASASPSSSSSSPATAQLLKVPHCHTTPGGCSSSADALSAVGAGGGDFRGARRHKACQLLAVGEWAGILSRRPPSAPRPLLSACPPGPSIRPHSAPRAGPDFTSSIQPHSAPRALPQAPPLNNLLLVLASPSRSSPHHTPAPRCNDNATGGHEAPSLHRYAPYLTPQP